MTIQEYRDECSDMPLHLEEFAQLATELTDEPDLAALAQAYLDASDAFAEALEDNDIEIG
jgi:hypothetical protein